MHLELWPHFSDFARFLCVFALNPADWLIGNALFSFNHIIAFTSQRFCHLVFVSTSFMIKNNYS